MFVNNLFNGPKHDAKPRNHRSRRPRRRDRFAGSANREYARALRVEPLESRLLLTAYIVDTLDDNPWAGDVKDELLSLREAIEAANTNAPFGDAPAGESGTVDAIAFADSLNGQTIVLDGAELIVSDALSITGPGADKLTISGNDASRVFSIGAGVNVEISGVTFVDGQAVEGGAIYNEGTLTVASCTLTNNSARWDGGAIYNLATLTVIDSILSSNSAAYWGGAICNYSTDVEFPPSVTITNSTLTNNHAGDDGGAIYNEGTLTVTSSVFTNNSADWYGGAICNYVTDSEFVTSLTLTDCSFTGNTAYQGGGIANVNRWNEEHGGTVTITGSTFSANSANNGGASYHWAYPYLPTGTVNITGSMFSENEAPVGGAVYLSNGLGKIASSTFSNNTADWWGGAIFTYTRWTVVEIKDSTLSGNWAGKEGGAIDKNFGTLKISNSTISGNSTDGVGGAIYNWGGTLEITNGTLIGNRADADGNGSGDGGALYDDGDATYLLHNTIAAGNLRGTAGSDRPDDFSATLEPASSHNLIGDADTSGGLIDGVNGNIVGNAGSGTIDIATVLDTNLADNGGPTLTHALVAGSLAVNAGDNAKAVDADGNPLVYDQRGEGFARMYARTVDIGALEVQHLFVQIDVKPGSDPNAINLASNGVIAVAIFTTESFDAALVDASTVVFAGAGAVHWAQEDVDGDGDLDLVLHFRVQDTDLAEIYAQLLAEDLEDGVLDSNRQTTAVSLTGRTATDEYFAGFDDVDLFLSGKSVRDLLVLLAATGVI